jgi:hypothetical protein
VLVSATVKELVMGSGIALVDRGAHELKGVPGEWRLFAVQADDRRMPGVAGAPVPGYERPGVTDRAARRLARRAPGLARAGIRTLRRRSGAKTDC